MCRSLKSNVQANGLYKRPQLLHLQLDTYNEGGVVMTSAQVAEQIKSIFPLFYIQGKSSRVIIDLRCSSFFIMQADMLYTKKRKRVSEKGTLFFYVKVRTFPSSDFLICSKMFILEHVNR